jgi:hypothetical protein
MGWPLGNVCPVLKRAGNSDPVVKSSSEIDTQDRQGTLVRHELEQEIGWLLTDYLHHQATYEARSLERVEVGRCESA